MKLTIKKRDILIVSVLFLLLASPLVYSQVMKSFGIWIQISNQNPIIKLNNVSFSVSPTEAGITKVLISINVTDNNGVSQVNASTAVVNLTFGGSLGIWRENRSETGVEFGTCNNHTEGSVVLINCTVSLYYYDNASNNWRINVTVKDTAGGTGRNDSEIFTYNTLSALQLPHSFINFSTPSLGDANVPSYPHIVMNNTGNDVFDQINITAMALIGVTTPAETIAVTNFYANVSNTTAGNGVPLAAGAVTLRDPTSAAGSLPNATLYPGHSSSRFATQADTGNLSLFFWVDVPSSGLSTQQYNGTWNVTVINLP